MSEIPQGNPATPINIIGPSGQQPLQFQGLGPVPFDVGAAIPDRTQELFAQVEQNRATSAQAALSTIQSRERAAVAEAQGRTQSGFAGAVAGLASSVAAGLKIYEEQKQKQKTAEQEQLLGLIEREMRNRVLDLYSTVEENGSQEGGYVTFRQFTNELTQYSDVLTPEQITALQGIGFDALESVARNAATNKRELLQQTRDVAVQNRVSELNLKFAQQGEMVSMQRLDPNEYIANIERDVNNLAETGNYSNLELMEIYNELLNAASPYLSQSVREQIDFDERMTRGRTLRSRLLAIQNDNSLTETQRASEIAQLQVEANAFDLGINLSSILPTRQELIEQYASEQEFERQWQLDSVERLLSTDQRYSEAAAQYALGQALSLVRTQNTATLERYRQSDNPLLRQVALEADALQAAREEHLEYTSRRSEIEAELRGLDVIIEETRRQRNPTALLGNQRVTDPNLLRILEVIGEERGTISTEEAQAIAAQVAATRAGLVQEENERARRVTVHWNEWNNRGIDIASYEVSNPETWQELINEAQSYMNEAQAREAQRLIQSNRPSPTNFDNGVAITAPAAAPLYRSPDGLTFPVGAEQGQPTVTSEYGLRTHPVHGTQRFHHGIDLVFDGPVRTIQGGQVVHVHSTCDSNNSMQCGGGWGNFVTVRTPSGHYEHFSHLPQGARVTEGQELRAGDIVAASIASSGSSTGPHLDFTVFTPDVPQPEIDAVRASQQYTVNPREYFSMVENMEPVPYGAGLPPQQAAPPNGNYSALARNFTLQEMFRYTPALGGRIETEPGVYEQPSNVYNNSNIRNNQGHSINRSAYPERNNPEHNFGYDILRRDTAFREALASTSDRLNVPAMWLADVIEFESFMNPAEENGDGAVGLIQFFPGGGLADVAQWMGTTESRAKARLKRMSAAQQMTYVERWLYRYGPGDGHTFETITDLYGLVNQGPSYWDRKARGTALGIFDGKNTLEQLLNKLGADVGRRYNINSRNIQSRRIHSGQHTNCPECSRMMANFGRVLPHYGETA